MPWSGSGVYTRGYASWTSDATNGLPISATKFDTEDNDFAAGIQNCLTIDNQNKPNASLTWAQSLALSKGSDATVLSIARTGGTNNPSLIWAVADTADVVTATLNTGNLALSFSPSAYAFGNSADAPAFAFTGLGLTSNLESVGAVGLYVNGFTAGQSVVGFKVAGAAYGFIGVAGATNQVVTGSILGDTVLRSAGGNLWLTVDNGVTIKGGLTSAGVWQISDVAASPTLYAAGYKGVPQNLQTANYTAVLSDQGKSIHNSTGGALIFNIPSNASVAYPVGTTLTFTSGPGAGVTTISIASDTLTWANNNTTGSRSLAASGIATAIKIAATFWSISGAGIS